MDDFIHKFHNLEGITVTERKRNFYKLLKENEEILKNETIFDKIEPTSYLETLLKTDILIYCQQAPRLFEILKGRDEVIISKILKQKWFFTNYVQKLCVSVLVNEVLPSMSFVIRMKFLRKIAIFIKNESFLDAIFDEVNTKYGFLAAKTLMLSCSCVKISKILQKNNTVILSTLNLKELFDKDPELVILYIEINGKKDGYFQFNNNKILNYIAQKNPELFDKITEKYELKTKFGRRMSKKITVLKKSEILAQPDKFHHLKTDALVRKLGGDFKQFYIKLFPQNSPKRLPSNLYVYLNKYPKSKRFNFFEEVFLEVYKEPLTMHAELVTDYMLEHLINDSSKRETYVKIKMNKINGDKYVPYLPTNKSVKILQNKMNVANKIDDRTDIISQLVSTCKINNDYDAFLLVLQFFYQRHKHDIKQIRNEFLSLIQSTLDFTCFRKEHWSVIMDLIMIHKMYEENFNYCGFTILKYMEFLCENNETYDELFLIYVQLDRHFNRYSKINDSKFKKSLIIKYIEYDVSSFEEPNLYYSYIIEKVFRWNNCNVNDPILFESYIEFKSIITNLIKINKCQEYEKHFINVKNRNTFQRELLELYLNNYNRKSRVKNFVWLLKFDTKTIVHYYTTIFNCTVYSSNFEELNRAKIWKFIKKYSHLQFPQVTIECCLKRLEENNYSNSCQYLTALSTLMEPADYLYVTDKYKPTSHKVDVRSLEMRDIYHFQCSIVKSFVNTRCSSVIPVILNYCTADYLGSALAPLYSVFYRTPENQIHIFMEHLLHGAVSVRKHAFFLMTAVCSVDSVTTILKSFGEREKNISVLKHLFFTTLKFFIKNPSDELWELVKTHMLLVDKSDLDTLKYIVTCLNIPLNYLPFYVKYVWDFLEIKNVDEINLVDLRFSFVQSLDNNVIKTLETDFCIMLIRQLFLNYYEKFNDHFAMERFSTLSVHFVFEHPNGFNSILSVFEIWTAFKNIWSLKETLNYARKNLLFVFKSYCKNCLYKPNIENRLRKELIEKFSGIWLTWFNIIETFPEYLLLSSYKICLDSADVCDYALKFVSFSEGLVKQYGILIIDYLPDAVSSSLPYFSTCDLVLLKNQFINKALSNNASEFVYYTCLRLLLTAKPSRNCKNKLYEDNLNILKNCDYNSVKIKLNCADL